jgi:hypothetical protein
MIKIKDESICENIYEGLDNRNGAVEKTVRSDSELL